ncbi:MAG: DNA polymerase IV [Bryobacteraceae bacterium]|nr:MAG: DNA polymerase IV [Bryobacteraceae bacterium]
MAARRPRAFHAVKTIFHVDMDAFFVSVEELFDPGLKGKPVVVGGQKDERGVVAAASYEARKYGVHSAMPLRTAAKLCPHAIFLDGHPERYREYSHRVHEILLEFTPQVSMASIDEAYLDMTGTERLWGPPLRAATLLHDRIGQRTGLNCSIGAATSKMLAKICSDFAKPNGIAWVPPGMEAAFLAPLDVSRIPGVGRVTAERLREIGVRRIGDLARLDEDFLLRRFGQWGLALAGKARGADAGAWFEGEIGAYEDPKSISHEHTFSEDVRDPALLEATLARQAEKVGRRLREHRLFARTVELKLRYSDFTTLSRSKTLPEATDVDADLIAVSRELFRRTWKSGAPVRLIGMGVSGLDEAQGQVSLLEAERRERARQALAAADRIRDRFGEKSVQLAAGMTSEDREKVHENPAGLPGKGPRAPRKPA